MKITERLARLSAADLLAGREWLADCDWRETTAEDILDAATVSDAEVWLNVERSYDGGWAGFLRDRQPGPGTVESVREAVADHVGESGDHVTDEPGAADDLAQERFALGLALLALGVADPDAVIAEAQGVADDLAKAQDMGAAETPHLAAEVARWERFLPAVWQFALAGHAGGGGNAGAGLAARQAITCTTERETIREGIAAARAVVEAWSCGDLAGAVNALEEWANGAEGGAK